MSTLVAQTISNGTVSTSSANVIQGSAKAWVNFNGTGTVAIRASYNVSSVTRNSTGLFTVNFTNALADANYSAVLAVDNGGTSAYSNLYNNSLTASNFQIFTLDSAPAVINLPIVCAAVFR
jgi:hypothetical protein